MISVTLDWALAAGISSVILFVFLGRVFYNEREEKRETENETGLSLEDLTVCPFCGYAFYLLQREADTVSCPQCKSLLDNTLAKKQKDPQ